MSDLVTLTIDGQELSVPKGTLVVDAAKKIQNDIPVFCYHPKLEPVGMCRACLVEIGLPMRDRATGEMLKNEDGSPKLSFRGLQTACTVTVSDGMAVRTNTEPVTDARAAVIEFLLTSHPLDCPVCDKGGECPLQNLTMAHGKGTSRMVFADKLKMDKHVPLGELIFLDRERCIQCARCIRFQEEIVDDPVIRFHNRGRKLEIVTLSEPGFDSYWSGNTTDICPVGALTTADFRFGARPWELTPVASVCPHCPVGCNTTMSTRREALSGGRPVIKRIMPRQNEWVNEIWICDKGRFVHHFAEAGVADTGDLELANEDAAKARPRRRIKRPMLRRDGPGGPEGELVEVSWEEALDTVAGRLALAKQNNSNTNSNVAGLGSGRLSNEDQFLFQKLLRQGLLSNNIDMANRQMGGGEVVAQVGIGSGSNLKELKAGDAVLVVATDLHEEAPVWWLRLKQAAERGVTLVVSNGRSTRLDEYATHLLSYRPGEALATVRQLLSTAHVGGLGDEDIGDGDMNDGDFTRAVAQAADALIQAENLVVFYGSDGLSLIESDALARLLGNLLLIKNERPEGRSHVGRANNGLVPVWPHGNTQGAWDMGISPAFGPGYVPQENPGLDAAAIYDGVASGEVSALYVVGADPVGEGLMADRGQLDFLVVQEMFFTETAALADVVLPAQSWAEREGTFTSGERRVQRYYPSLTPVGDSRPDWQILAQIGERLGLGKAPFAASLVFKEIANSVGQYKGMDYRTLAKTEKQWPDVGGEDLYYGGNAYENRSGLGQQWPVGAEDGSDQESGDREVAMELFSLPDIVNVDVGAAASSDGLKVFNARSLYDAGTLVDQSSVIASRVVQPALVLNSIDAASMEIENGDQVLVKVKGMTRQMTVELADHLSAGLAMIRGASAIRGTVSAEISKLTEVVD